MKRAIYLLLALATLVTLVISGCAKQAPAPAPAPAAAPPPKAAPAPPPPIELAYANHMPPPPPPPAEAGGMVHALAWFPQEVEKATQGRVKFKMTWGAALGSPDTYLAMAGKGGVAQSGFVFSSYHPWGLPLTHLTGLPFLAPGLEAQNQAWSRLYREWAPMRQEFEKENVVALWAITPLPYILVSKRPVTTVADLKGMKLIGSGFAKDVVAQLGAAATMMPFSEIYDPLSKGTVEGVAAGFDAMTSWRFYEPANYVTNIAFIGCRAMGVWVMNKDLWGKISTQDQNTIMQLGDRAAAISVDQSLKMLERDIKMLKDRGIKFLTMPPAEQAKMKEMAAPVSAQIIAEAEKKGVPTKEFLERYDKLLKELIPKERAFVLPE